MPIRSLSEASTGLARRRFPSPALRHVGRSVRVLLLASVLAVPMSKGAAAQTIDGVLLEQGTDRPIELGLVTLLTVDGDSVSSVLTNGDGRFRVSADREGDFLLAATALGYEPTVAHSVFTLPEGAGMSLQFRIKPLAVQLEGLVVEGRILPIARPKLVQNGFADRAGRASDAS